MHELLWLCALLSLSVSGASTPGPAPLETVPNVVLSSYMGTWYEIASFPQRFQKGCTGTTAEYTILADGKIEVVNRCRKETLEGKESVARGRVRVVDPTTNAKLEVCFFWPFWGDYWIIDLESNYEHAVVGHPSRTYLWILSRKPQMESAVYDGILNRLRRQGYDTTKLVRTLQSEGR